MKVGRSDESIKISPEGIVNRFGDFVCVVCRHRQRPSRRRPSRQDADHGLHEARKCRAEYGRAPPGAHFWMVASTCTRARPTWPSPNSRRRTRSAEAEHDAGSMSGDLTQMGDVLREAGRPDDALARYAEGLAVVEKAPGPGGAQGGDRRNWLFEQGRVAATRGDFATARAKAEAYAAGVTSRLNGRSKFASSTSSPGLLHSRASSTARQAASSLSRISRIPACPRSAVGRVTRGWPISALPRRWRRARRSTTASTSIALDQEGGRHGHELTVRAAGRTQLCELQASSERSGRMPPGE